MGGCTRAGGGGGMAPRLTLAREAGGAAPDAVPVARERSPRGHPPTAAGRRQRHRTLVRRVAVVVVASLVSGGCATGHLLDRGRRYERPIAYERAAIADGRLTVSYTAAEMNQFWRKLGTHQRTAAVPLAQFADEGLTADRVRVERLRDDAPVTGTPTALRLAPPCDALLVRDADGGTFLDPAVLTETRMAPWVWPLLPLAVVYDAVAVPMLLVFAPAVIIPGD